jgi:hypothetical protein
MGTIYKIMLPMSLNNINRCTLHVVICIETSSIEIFISIDEVPVTFTELSSAGEPSVIFTNLFLHCICKLYVLVCITLYMSPEYSAASPKYVEEIIYIYICIYMDYFI